MATLMVDLGCAAGRGDYLNLSNKKVALIVMPVGPVDRPCIQIGILHSVLLKKNINVDDYYLNLEFAKYIGAEFYHSLSLLSDKLIGDWLFAHEYFRKNDDMDYLKYISDDLIEKYNLIGDEGTVKEKKDALIEKLKIIRNFKVKEWLADCVEKNDWGNYSFIGFSCTFSQIIPSLLFSKLLRSKYPNIKIIFGGSAFEGTVSEEILKMTEDVDCIVDGEGESAIYEVFCLIEEGKELPRLYRSPHKTLINEVPIPNYDQYYKMIYDESYLSNLSDEKYGAITIETSRGCWWGEKKHCKFCGISPEKMPYSSKDYNNVLNEMEILSEKYDSYQFCVIDNILNFDYFKTLLPALSKLSTSYRLSFETKANLKHDDIELMKKAGVVWIQPGIESLSTSVLKLMYKGSTASINLNLLKWCKYHDIEVAWNLLMGFPGEKEEHYNEMIDLIPKLAHLKPPLGCGFIRLDRFSPYFNQFVRSKGNHIEDSFDNIEPCFAYSQIYSSTWDIDKLAYYYTASPKTGVLNSTYNKLKSLIKKWQQNWTSNNSPILLFKKRINSGHLIDSRYGGLQVTEISGDYFKIAKCLDKQPRTIETLCECVSLSFDKVHEICGHLIQQNFIYFIDNKFIWLPIPDKL